LSPFCSPISPNRSPRVAARPRPTRCGASAGYPGQAAHRSRRGFQAGPSSQPESGRRVFWSTRWLIPSDGGCLCCIASVHEPAVPGSFRSFHPRGNPAATASAVTAATVVAFRLDQGCAYHRSRLDLLDRGKIKNFQAGLIAPSAKKKQKKGAKKIKEKTPNEIALTSCVRPLP